VGSEEARERRDAGQIMPVSALLTVPATDEARTSTSAQPRCSPGADESWLLPTGLANALLSASSHSLVRMCAAEMPSAMLWWILIKIAH
jgi:hypothetical protein